MTTPGRVTKDRGHRLAILIFAADVADFMAAMAQGGPVGLPITLSLSRPQVPRGLRLRVRIDTRPSRMSVEAMLTEVERQRCLCRGDV